MLIEEFILRDWGSSKMNSQDETRIKTSSGAIFGSWGGDQDEGSTPAVPKDCIPGDLKLVTIKMRSGGDVC